MSDPMNETGRLKDEIDVLIAQLAELREALDTGVNRFYLYEGDPAYETMKAALEGVGDE